MRYPFGSTSITDALSDPRRAQPQIPSTAAVPPAQPAMSMTMRPKSTAPCDSRRQGPGALPNRPSKPSRFIGPIDPNELTRRLHGVLAQQQRAEAAAQAGQSRSHHASPLHALAQSSQLRSRLLSPKQPAAAAACDTSAPPRPYVPQQAASQFFHTTTVGPQWRPSSLRRPKKQPASQDAKLVRANPVPAASAQPGAKGHGAQPAYVAQHAYTDSLTFPAGSDSANKHNRKILEWAHSAAEPSGPDQNRQSSEAESQDRDKQPNETARETNWSVVAPAVGPQVVQEHRVDWTQKDETTWQPKRPSHEGTLAHVRQSRSLWTLRTRSHSPAKGAGQGRKASVGTAAAAASPSQPLSPTRSQSSAAPKAYLKTLKSSKNGFFSLFKLFLRNIQ